MAINFANVKAFTISQYEQRSYIQSNGTDNYIPLNTSFSGEIDIDFSMDSLPSSAGCLIGDGYNGQSSNFEIAIYHSGKIYVSFGMNDSHEIATLTTGVRYKLKMERSQSVMSFVVYEGDTAVGEWSSIGSFSTNSLYLCAYVNSYNHTLSEKMACKIYSLGMGAAGNVHAVVPVRNKATNAVGLCDPTKSSQYFMGMEGTIDSSSIGEVVEPVTALPGLDVIKIQNANGDQIWGSYEAFPYRRLEYIQSTGTQALDTGVNCGNNSYLKLRVEDTSNGAASQQQGRGAVQNNQRFAAGYSNGNYFFGMGASWHTGSTATAGIHTLHIQGPECNKESGSQRQGFKIDDNTFVQTTYTFPSGSWTKYSVYLLGSRGNTSGGIQGPVSCKLYYAELGYTNTSTLGNYYNKRYYPAQRKSDGKLGFYDTVNNGFLCDLVSGSDANSLVAGPVVDEYWDLTNPT